MKLSLEHWENGDILVKDDDPNEFYVFNKLYKDTNIFISLKAIKSPIEDRILRINDIPHLISYTPCHKAYDKELKTFYSILAARNLTWNAYNKELLRGNYTYFYPKNGHYYFNFDEKECKRHWMCYANTDNDYSMTRTSIQTVDQFNKLMELMDIDFRLKEE